MTVTPKAGAASAIVTGGLAVTAVIAVPAGLNGGYIVNPYSNTDQGLGTAEWIYISEVTDATTSAHGTTVGLAPGQSYNLTVGSINAVSVNALSNGHKFTVVWY